MIISESLESQVLECGFAQVPGVLSETEIERLRSQIDDHFESHDGFRSHLGHTQINAAKVVPSMAWVFSHPNVVQMCKRALGQDRIVFTGHADIVRNRLSGWHKDATEDTYLSREYFSRHDCRVYKVAFYLQDHIQDTNGFWIREGSHRTKEFHEGNPIHPELHAGDAVVFDVRATHSGQFFDPIEKVILKMSQFIRKVQRINPKYDIRMFMKLKDLYWKLRGKPNKYAIFFTYGLDNECTELFANKNGLRQKTLQEEIGQRSVSSFPTELVESLRNQGVKIHQSNVI